MGITFYLDVEQVIALWVEYELSDDEAIAQLEAISPTNEDHKFSKDLAIATVQA